MDKDHLQKNSQSKKTQEVHYTNFINAANNVKVTYLEVIDFLNL